MKRRTCRNPHCGWEYYGDVPICRSCCWAGKWGAVVAFVVGALLKLAGVL